MDWSPQRKQGNCLGRACPTGSNPIFQRYLGERSGGAGGQVAPIVPCKKLFAQLVDMATSK
jgi:hypothetical protein